MQRIIALPGAKRALPHESTLPEGVFYKNAIKPGSIAMRHLCIFYAFALPTILPFEKQKNSLQM
jgi:hypothetical protein